MSRIEFEGYGISVVRRADGLFLLSDGSLGGGPAEYPVTAAEGEAAKRGEDRARELLLELQERHGHPAATNIPAAAPPPMPIPTAWSAPTDAAFQPSPAPAPERLGERPLVTRAAALNIPRLDRSPAPEPPPPVPEPAQPEPIQAETAVAQLSPPPELAPSKRARPAKPPKAPKPTRPAKPPRPPKARIPGRPLRLPLAVAWLMGAVLILTLVLAGPQVLKLAGHGRAATALGADQGYQFSLVGVFAIFAFIYPALGRGLGRPLRRDLGWLQLGLMLAGAILVLVPGIAAPLANGAAFTVWRWIGAVGYGLVWLGVAVWVLQVALALFRKPPRVQS